MAAATVAASETLAKAEKSRGAPTAPEPYSLDAEQAAHSLNDEKHHATSAPVKHNEGKQEENSKTDGEKQDEEKDADLRDYFVSFRPPIQLVSS